ALGMVAIPTLNGLLGVAQRYLSSSVGEGVIYDLRNSLFVHLQRMSLRFFTHTKTGELMSRLNSDVIGAQQAVTGTLVTILSNVIAVVSTLAIMLSLEWRLTLMSMSVLPFFAFAVRHVGRTLRRLRRRAMEHNAEMNALMHETLNISGALLVKLFGRQEDEIARFADRGAEVRDIGIQQAIVFRWFFMGLGLVSAFGTAIVFWWGGRLALQGAFSVGTIVAFGTYLTQLYGPLMSMMNVRVEFVTSMVSFERVFEVLDLPVEITDRPGAKTLQRVEGHVEFADVCFSYAAEAEGVVSGLEDVIRYDWYSQMTLPTKKSGDGFERDASAGASPHGRRWAVHNVSFEILPGQVAALVGPSGAGKTTITYLLPRLYDPTDGNVTLDGHDLRDIKLDSLSAQIGMVTQETHLFHDSIRANLLYARPDASQEDLEEACRAANILNFVLSLPESFDTVVGERGYRLSGGEKQRIAMARVLLKNPRILILDEATSSLDSQSEALIQTALKHVMRGRTSLVIAHRLSTILAADVILVMDDGRLVERGTHSELLAAGGLYAALYETQFGAIHAQAV
ncbi:MAG: ABC transporter ATP-binding protein, partial [Dehalococcoidia bacterium]